MPKTSRMPPPRWVDAHCHLADRRLDAGRAAFVERAAADGVGAWLQGGVDPGDWRRQRRLREAYPEAWPVFGITAVYSDEMPVPPAELGYDRGKGFRCVCPQGTERPFTCDKRNLIFGTAGFVTGAFGFAAASTAVRGILDPGARSTETVPNPG